MNTRVSLTNHSTINSDFSDSYAIRGTKCTLSAAALRAAQFALGSFAALTSIATPVVWAIYKYKIPIWGYGVGVGLIVITAGLCAGSCIFVYRVGSEMTPLTQDQAPKGHSLYTVSDLNPQFVLLDELCEGNTDGREMPCSMDRINEIIEQLKKNDMLPLLNAIPGYLSNNFMSSVIVTPLHYWAKKGNLLVVKVLLENGAKDYFTEGRDVHELTSGVYLAALYGHADVVEYLLKNGSRADVAFAKHNVLLSFVPKLVFEVAPLIMGKNQEEDVNQALRCLRIILTHLKRNNPRNLNFQLKIPIDNGLNSFYWVEWKYCGSNEATQEFRRAKQLGKVLAEFGADNQEVYSVEELQAFSCNVGNGFTLGAASGMKYQVV
jgi:hypothetical protein